MSLRWIVIYPRGDRTRLDVAQARDYEMRSDWDMAYDNWWPNDAEGERECREKMRELAEKYGLRHPGPKYLT
jgi:hypothetical protein